MVVQCTACTYLVSEHAAHVAATASTIAAEVAAKAHSFHNHMPASRPVTQPTGGQLRSVLCSYRQHTLAAEFNSTSIAAAVFQG